MMRWMAILLFGVCNLAAAQDKPIKSDESEFNGRSELGFGVNYVGVISEKKTDMIVKSFHYNNNAHSGYEYKIMINNNDLIFNGGISRKLLPNFGGIFISVGIYLEYPIKEFKMNDEIHTEDSGECGSSYVHFYRGENGYLEFYYIFKKDYKMWSNSKFFITTYRLSFGEEPSFSIYYAPVRTMETKESYCDAKEAFLSEKKTQALR